MENTNVNEIIEAAVETLPVPAKDKPSIWAIVILILAGIGLGSSVYFTYKGIKFVVKRFKDGTVKVQKASESDEKAEEVKEEPKAEEQTEE